MTVVRSPWSVVKIVYRVALCIMLSALCFFGAMLLTLCVPAQGQQTRVPRIGLLSPGRAGPSPGHEAFRQGLYALGYVEGKNIVIEHRFAEGKPESFLDLATELVHLKVDVIVAGSFPGTRAVKQATSTIPIVTISADPVGTGLAQSLSRPGGNVTGFSYMTPDLSGKRLELLKEAVARLTRVAVLWNSAYSHEVLAFRETELAAKALGVQLQFLEVRDSNEFDAAFSAMARKRTEALIVFENVITIFHRRLIADLAAKNRLPSMYERREFVEDGGLIAYGPSVPDMYRRAATFVDKILKGTKPQDLPVEQPTKFELIINLKTAKQIGVTIPPNVLARADQVIK